MRDRLLRTLQELVQLSNLYVIDFELWQLYCTCCRNFAEKLALTTHERLYCTRISDAIASHLTGNSALINVAKFGQIFKHGVERELLENIAKQCTLRISETSLNCKLYVQREVAEIAHRTWHNIPQRSDASFAGLFIHLALESSYDNEKSGNISKKKDAVKTNEQYTNTDDGDDENRRIAASWTKITADLKNYLDTDSRAINDAKQLIQKYIRNEHISTQTTEFDEYSTQNSLCRSCKIRQVDHLNLENESSDVDGDSCNVRDNISSRETRIYLAWNLLAIRKWIKSQCDQLPSICSAKQRKLRCFALGGNSEILHTSEIETDTNANSDENFYYAQLWKPTTLLLKNIKPINGIQLLIDECSILITLIEPLKALLKLSKSVETNCTSLSVCWVQHIQTTSFATIEENLNELKDRLLRVQQEAKKSHLAEARSNTTMSGLSNVDTVNFSENISQIPPGAQSSRNDVSLRNVQLNIFEENESSNILCVNPNMHRDDDQQTVNNIRSNISRSANQLSSEVQILPDIQDDQCMMNTSDHDTLLSHSIQTNAQILSEMMDTMREIRSPRTDTDEQRKSSEVLTTEQTGIRNVTERQSRQFYFDATLTKIATILADQMESVSADLRIILRELVTEDALRQDALGLLRYLEEQALIEQNMELITLLKQIRIAVDCGDESDSELRKMISELRSTKSEELPPQLKKILPNQNFSLLTTDIDGNEANDDDTRLHDYNSNHETNRTRNSTSNLSNYNEYNDEIFNIETVTRANNANNNSCLMITDSTLTNTEDQQYTQQNSDDINTGNHRRHTNEIFNYSDRNMTNDLAKDLEVTLNTEKGRVKDLTMRLNTEKEIHAATKHELVECKEKLVSSQQSLANIEQDLNTVQQERDNVAYKLTEAQRISHAAFEAETNANVATLQLFENLREKDVSLQDCLQQLSVIKSELQKCLKERENLEKNIAEVHTDFDDVSLEHRKEVNKLRAQLYEKDKLINERDMSNLALNSDLKNMNDEITELAEINRSLERKLSEAKFELYSRIKIIAAEGDKKNIDTQTENRQAPKRTKTTKTTKRKQSYSTAPFSYSRSLRKAITCANNVWKQSHLTHKSKDLRRPVSATHDEVSTSAENEKDTQTASIYRSGINQQNKDGIRVRTKRILSRKKEHSESRKKIRLCNNVSNDDDVNVNLRDVVVSAIDVLLPEKNVTNKIFNSEKNLCFNKETVDAMKLINSLNDIMAIRNPLEIEKISAASKALKHLVAQQTLWESQVVSTTKNIKDDAEAKTCNRMSCNEAYLEELHNELSFNTECSIWKLPLGYIFDDNAIEVFDALQATLFFQQIDEAIHYATQSQSSPNVDV